MGKIVKFLRDWTLPISMIVGALGYFLIEALPLSGETNDTTYYAISHYIQPVLLFSMLFLAFTKVAPHDMQPHRWQGWMLLIQTSLFVLFSVLALSVESHSEKVLLEGAMICFVCPTATAASVITGKLGGNIAGVATYLLLCNLMVSLVAPVFLTMVEPHSGLDFLTSFFMIMGKVFPLLICPLFLAWLVRFLMPHIHEWLRSRSGLAFYFWAVGLALAILVTVRSIMESSISIFYLIGLAVISLVSCIFQFTVGKTIGSHYDKKSNNPQGNVNRITAGQAFGQKNTVFIIWLGLVFLDPVTSVVGGFYSIWHNVINSYQLYKKRKE